MFEFLVIITALVSFIFMTKIGNDIGEYIFKIFKKDDDK